MKKLIINRDKKNIFNSLSIIIIAIIGLTFFYLSLPNTPVNIFVIVIKLYIIGLNSIFSIGMVLALFFLYKPIAIIDTNGIYIKYIGLVEWDNIKNISINHSLEYPLIGYVGIDVKHRSKIKNLSMLGRITIFISEWRGFTDLSISNSDIPFEEVKSFIQQFI